ncbi:hypothetical protein KC902_03960 [Candidatus Kaiserbacteria bacterium]|nr:hypothetical protein [Candidatus Kaiserbacteria bacterium]
MLSIETLKKMLSGAERSFQQMQAAIAPEQKKIEELQGKAEKVYSKHYINEKIQEVRTAISDRLYGIFAEINKAADQATDSRRFYESTSFMLSRERFHEDDGINAGMKLAAMSEYAKMALPDVHLVADAAKAENKLASLWIARLASQERTEDIAQWVDIGNVQTPAQAEGLRLIANIIQVKATAELSMRGSVISPFSRPLSPAEKLALARQATPA